MATYDLLIRGGKVVDGTGKTAFTGDVAVANGRIAAVGKDLGSARRTLNADGLVVAPGWVDVHTHYDGQVVWDQSLSASLNQGATTVVMGNCGVGFAPVYPDRREWLIFMMESVEDIPRESLSAGIDWRWETFPEYLDALAAIPHTIDFGTQVPHAALRVYVMGDRGANNELATPQDIEKMATITRTAITAGALGFSTSRTMVHGTPEGVPIPGTFASAEELIGIGRGIAQAGRGVMEIVTDALISTDPTLVTKEMAWMRQVASNGCPITFLLAQTNNLPNIWREMLTQCEAANRAGARITPQVFSRPVTILFSFQGEHPFQYMPSYAAIKDLPHAEKIQALRTPDLRRRLLAEEDPTVAGISVLYRQASTWEMTFPMGQPLNYFPDPQNNVAAIAARRGCSVKEAVYDLLLEQEGRSFLMYTVAGYANKSRESLYEMLTHPMTVMGGSDAGAHMRFICDVSSQTFMLTNWVRECGEGHRYHLPIEFVVKKQTHDTAHLFGMDDRGTLEPGKKADINLIDLNNLRIETPEMVYDLPAGKPRLLQRAYGYEATVVSGEIVQEKGQQTGALPGQLVRGGQCAAQKQAA